MKPKHLSDPLLDGIHSTPQRGFATEPRGRFPSQYTEFRLLEEEKPEPEEEFGQEALDTETPKSTIQTFYRDFLNFFIKINIQVRKRFTREHKWSYYLLPKNSCFGLIAFLFACSLVSEITSKGLVDELNDEARLATIILSAFIGPVILFPVSWWVSRWDASDGRLHPVYAFRLSFLAVLGFLLVFLAETTSKNLIMTEFNLVFPLPQTMYLSQYSLNNALCVNYKTGHYFSLAFLIWGTILIVSENEAEIGSILNLGIFMSGYTFLAIFLVRLELVAKSKEQINLTYFLQQVFFGFAFFMVILAAILIYFFWDGVDNFFSETLADGDKVYRPNILLLWVANLFSTVLFLVAGCLLLRFGSAVLLMVVLSPTKTITFSISQMIYHSKFPTGIEWLAFVLIGFGSLIYFCSPHHQPSYSSAIEKLQNDAERTLSVELILKDPDILKIPLREIDIGPIIGSGTFGQVFTGQWKMQKVALKCLHCSMLQLNAEVMEDFLGEIRIMSALKHPNIVSFKGVAYEEGSYLYLVSELVPRGSLSELLYGQDPKFVLPRQITPLIPENFSDLSKQREDLSFSTKLKILITAAKGLEYLHQCQVIHRDLKSGNILVTQNYISKLTDFGISRIKPVIDATMSSVGTPVYMAPEVISKSRYSFKADVYSFGVMMNEVLTNEKPYSDKLNSRKQIFEIMSQVQNGAMRPELPLALSVQPPFSSTPAFSLSSSLILLASVPPPPTLIFQLPSSSSSSTNTNTNIPLPQQSSLEQQTSHGVSGRKSAPVDLILLVQECWNQEADSRPHASEILARLQRIVLQARK